MARLLAVDWDRKEIRLVVGFIRRKELHIERVEAVYLQPDEDVSSALHDAVEMIRAGKAFTLLGVNRSQVELLQMQVPVVSDNELPLMVANQAMRDSSTITEESTLDFITTGTTDEGALNVTAAAISSAGQTEVINTAEAAGIHPSKIQLRPYAAARLFALTSGIDEPCLLINMLSDSFDLTVVENRKVKISRTIQLPDETSAVELHQKILAEIHRTLMLITQEQIAAESVKHIYVFGGEEHLDLFLRVQEEFQIECGAYEVFESVGASKVTISTDPGRYASLVGMMLQHSKGETVDFDFANPRKAPPPPNRNRQKILIAAGVVALVAAGWMYLDDQLADITDKVAALTVERSNKKELAEKAITPARQLKALKDWEARNINWLDELRDISVQLPPSKDAMIQRMSLSLAPEGRGAAGQISFQGFVRDSSIVYELEQSLSDKHHRIRIPRVKERVGDFYGSHYDATLGVNKREPVEYLEQPKTDQAEVPETATKSTSGREKTGN
ncbi:Competence protein A [Polystyrenella longa]|uniref:Competence protein A n=1 Tax=Polystyrenella longa TaxID=2528007 RepID=A0A518CRD3_9PLAN|nr:hypothetical protein [Polystyrenella longa]QDU81789.1 Competence protein A [Polystyrenella longa]